MSELSGTERRARIHGSVVRAVIYAALALVVYLLVPFSGRFGGVVAARSALGLLMLVVVLGWQLRAVVTAPFPQLRAVEGFALVVPLTAVLFASTYLALSAATPDAFSERLDHVGALYLSMATMTTIGFGDIAARSDAARIVVMVQMVADVAVLDIATRIAVLTVRSALEGQPR